MSTVSGRVTRAVALTMVVAACLGGALAGAAAAAQAGPAAPSAAPKDRTFPTDPAQGYHEHRGLGGETDVNVCSDEVGAGFAHCNARVRTDPGAKRFVPGAPGGATPSVNPPTGSAYGPGELQAAYQAPSATGGAGVTVAIVDAYDNPRAEADLAVYRSAYGLPPCTTANGCFRKVNQTGGTKYPAANAGWAEEIALDLDMVSAICPKCNILLVEANSNSLGNLGTAVNLAVSMGAVAVSNSYGASEFSQENFYTNTYYSHPGVLIAASSGDSGYRVEFPAVAPGVLAVGGTRLTRANGGFTETAWSGAGSGCSAFVTPKPAWQTDAGCANRTVADVSAVADPSTGVFVYNTYNNDPGFMVFGGTSVASPIIAAMYALAGNPASSAQVNAYPYSHTKWINDITSGSNGSCSPAYLCTAGPGFDGPTGLGSPRGIGAFLPPGVEPGGDFSVGASPATVQVAPGAGTSSSLTLATSGGFSGTVGFSTSVSPATGVTASVSPASVDLPGSTVPTLNVTADPSAPDGNYTVTVTAVGTGNITHTTLVTVKVATPDFTIAASPTTVALGSGGSGGTSLALAPLNGFTGAVNLSTTVSPASSGLSATPSVPSVTLPTATSPTLALTADPTASGTYQVTVTGTPAAGGASRSAVVTVTVGSPDFSLAISATKLLIPRGSSRSATISLTQIAGFTDPVKFSVTGLRAGETARFSWNPISSGSTLMTVSSPWSDPTGTITLTITGTSGGLSHSVPLTVQTT